MHKGRLSSIFLDVYKNLQIFDDKKIKVLLEDEPHLEETLENYLIDILGYKIRRNYEDNYREIRIYFENIIRNSKYKNYSNIIDYIENYKKEFIQKIDDHKYVSLFIETMKKMYSKSYDGKMDFGINSKSEFSIVAIRDKGSSLSIGRLPRKDEPDLPSIYINDISNFENILSQYIESVANSDSFYNVFNNQAFSNVTFEEKVKMIFECTMLNATSTDLAYVENFFRKYNDFINDKTFENVRYPNYMGELFDDQLFVMSKRSELQYETPYYLAFMLRNKRVELPNIRLGIEEKDNKKVAHIIATQSAQKVLDRDNLSQIQDEIKKELPTDPYFRFYNPSHLVSVLISFGVLNGMGIKDVEVKDFLPFRYKKTILDRQMNQDEADNYQTRLTNKNLITYMRLIELSYGINVQSYPELGTGLKLKLDDEITFKNEFLQNIYDTAYKFGEENKTLSHKK